MSRYFLVIKRITQFDNFKEIGKAYQHYVDIERAIRSQSNYIDSLLLLDNNGEVIKEYYHGGNV